MQNIDDLLKKHKSGSNTIQSSSSSTLSAFDDKMEEIKIHEDERKVEQSALDNNIPYINLYGFPISPETLTLVSRQESQEYKIITFFKGEDGIRLAAVDPSLEMVKTIATNLNNKFNVSVEVYVISEHSFVSAFKLFATVPIFKKVETGVTIKESDLDRFKDEVNDFKLLNEKIKKVNISDIITLIIAASLKGGISDIHIEAEEKDIKIRFRIDGILQDIASLDASLWSKVIARIKLLSGLKINITLKPQDGRFTIKLTDDKVDVRVSCLPTSYGESVVMRLLRAKATSLQFEDLGIRGSSYKMLKDQVEKTNGMIMTTGPTGSGKTTTLYAILNKLNDEQTKIITLEDPVEYRLNGINQSQIDRSKGYSFADGLRSILRQDPDIIMVGELRDFETADVAINAALTGHLVVSTIHTNSAAGAVPRFLAMDVKPFLLAPALNAIIGQRLVRRVCKQCNEKIELEEEVLKRVKSILSEISEASGETVDINNLQFVKGKGCDECNGTGYKGRVGIYEILLMNKDIENLILSGRVSEYDMQEIGVKNGMVTMVQDGLLKANDGITTVEEVFRVIE